MTFKGVNPPKTRDDLGVSSIIKPSQSFREPVTNKLISDGHQR